MSNIYGPPLPLTQKVDGTIRFDSQQLNDVLMRAALERAGAPLAVWNGHVQYETTSDPPGVAATVNFWKVGDVEPTPKTKG